MNVGRKEVKSLLHRRYGSIRVKQWKKDRRRIPVDWKVSSIFLLDSRKFLREEDKVKVVKGGVKIFISERTNFEIEIGGPRFYLRFRSRIFTFEEHFRLKVIHTLDCLEFFFFGSEIALNTYEILSWIKRKQRNFLTRRIFLEIKLKENGSNAPFWNWERIVSEIDIITNLW